MSESIDLKTLWSQQPDAGGSIDAGSFHTGIRQSLKRQRQQISQYYWSSFVYQLIIYALAAHVFVRYYGNVRLMVMSVALILLYVPFTLIQRKRYIALCTQGSNRPDQMNLAMKEYVALQARRLENFYRFKKWYDRLVLPISLALIVALIFELFGDGGITAHWISASIVFLLFLAMFVMALKLENLKRFREPIAAFRKLASSFED